MIHGPSTPGCISRIRVISAAHCARNVAFVHRSEKIRMQEEIARSISKMIGLEKYNYYPTAFQASHGDQRIGILEHTKIIRKIIQWTSPFRRLTHTQKNRRTLNILKQKKRQQYLLSVFRRLYILRTRGCSQ